MKRKIRQEYKAMNYINLIRSVFAIGAIISGFHLYEMLANDQFNFQIVLLLGVLMICTELAFKLKSQPNTEHVQQQSIVYISSKNLFFSILGTLSVVVSYLIPSLLS